MDFHQPGPATVSHNALLIFSVVSLSTMMSSLLSQCYYAPPLITLNPVSQVANPDSRVEFAAQATGAKTYAWSKDGQEISGQTEASLVMDKVAQTDEGSYICLIANDKGSVATEPVTLEVNDPPVIVENFTAQIVSEGQEIILTGQVSGTEPMTYRILHNNKLVAETTECRWRIEQAILDDRGPWRFAVTNVTGISLRSDPVNVIVKPIVITPEGEGEPQLEGEGEPPVEGEPEGEIGPEGEPPIEGEPEPILCQQNFCDTANNGDNASAPIDKSFCDYFADLFNNAPRNLLGNYVKFVDLFDPTKLGDMNGASSIDKSQGEDKMTIQVGSNHIPDCAYELKLIEAVLLKPDFCQCSSGLNHKLVHEAWNFNMARLSQDFAGLYWTLADSVLPGFKQILCVHMMIGDGNIQYYKDDVLLPLTDPENINANRVIGSGSGGLAQGIAFLLGKNIANPRPSLADYATLAEYFGPNGDADGDSYTNTEEFDAFGTSPEAYVTAALDPKIKPEKR